MATEPWNMASPGDSLPPLSVYAGGFVVSSSSINPVRLLPWVSACLWIPFFCPVNKSSDSSLRSSPEICTELKYHLPKDLCVVLLPVDGEGWCPPVCWGTQSPTHPQLGWKSLTTCWASENNSSKRNRFPVSEIWLVCNKMCCQFKTRCAVRLWRYSINQRYKYFINNFIMITCWNRDMWYILGEMK